MPITANVTNEQITASVGETQIDVSVSGGVGPSGAAGSNGQAATVAVGTVTTGAAGSQASVTNVGTSSAAVFDFTIPAGATGATGPQGATGPAGTTTWAGITDKPAFAAVATSGSASDLSTGTLDASRLPASVVRTNTASAGPIQVYAVTAFPSPPPADPNDYMLFEGYDGVDMTSNISASGVIACTAITLNGSDLATTLSGKADALHQHSATGDLTFAGATAGQVLTVNSGATALVWATPTTYTLPQATASVLGGVTVSTGLSVSSGAVSVSYGTSSGTACQGNDARLSDARTPTSHTHGNVTNDGKIGTAASQIVVTTTGGALTTAATISAATQVNGLATIATSGSASDLGSGTVPVGRLGSSGTPSSSTYLRGDNTWGTPTASVSYASDTQARELTATTVAMNPSNVRTAITSAYRVHYSTTYTANGGSAAALNVTATQITGNSSANGTSVVYQGSQFSLRGRQSFDFSKRCAFRIVLIRQSCPSTGIARFWFGGLSNAYSWATPDRRGFGFEIRQTRIWVLAHNGTSLTSADTGIDGPSADFGTDASEIWVESDGAGNVTLSHSLNAGAVSTYTTTGGPSAALTSENPNAWAGVNNGATASAANFVFQPHLIVVT